MEAQFLMVNLDMNVRKGFIENQIFKGGTATDSRSRKKSLPLVSLTSLHGMAQVNTAMMRILLDLIIFLRTGVPQS